MTIRFILFLRRFNWLGAPMASAGAMGMLHIPMQYPDGGIRSPSAGAMGMLHIPMQYPDGGTHGNEVAHPARERETLMRL